METKEIVLGDARPHLGIPADSGKHQAVIVIGEGPTAATELIWAADLLSSQGYVTLAFPLLEQSFDAEQLKHRIAAAITFLNDRPDVCHGNIGVWSFGAACGAIASTVPGIAAAIILHLDADTGPAGDWQPAEPFDPHDVQCPVLLIFATSRPDADDVIERIRNDLEGAGKMVEIQRYNAPASQTSVTMESFPARVIADRWDHVQAFLCRHPS
jgi:dienelactone hydrolase